MEREFYSEYFRLEGRHWWFVGRRELFLRLLRSRDSVAGRSIHALDFGCGTGAFLEYLDEFGSVSAVDSDASAVSFCHERGRSEVVHVPCGVGLPFRDDTFDLVTSLDVLEHIEDDVAALRELRRVLRPGGTLLVSVPAFMFLWGDQDEVSHHYRRYRSPQLTSALVEAGLKVDRVSYFNTLLFPPIAAARVIRRFVRAPAADRSDFSMTGDALNAPLARVFAAEAALVMRTRLPFGVSLLALAST